MTTRINPSRKCRANNLAKHGVVWGNFSSLHTSILIKATSICRGMHLLSRELLPDLNPSSLLALPPPPAQGPQGHSAPGCHVCTCMERGLRARQAWGAWLGPAAGAALPGRSPWVCFPQLPWAPRAQHPAWFSEHVLFRHFSLGRRQERALALQKI